MLPGMEPAAPRFSVVTAAYDVARYLPEFIACLEAQTFDLTRVEVIVVDDGSTDETPQVLAEWAARRPGLVRVLTQANAGQGAARNAGMDAASGEWVTFPDPDDVVDPNYLETVDAFLTAHPEAHMVAANRWLWSEETGELENTHPLETFFRYDRLVDLADADGRFHGSAPAAFFPLAGLRELGTRYDDRIRPNFEDGHFCSSYLLHHEQPLVGFLQSTRYHYRKRSDASSSLGSSMTNPGRYTDVFTYGYEAILDEARRLRGDVPTWLKHFLCYEIAGYFSAAMNNSVAVLSEGPIVEQFHERVRGVLRQVQPRTTLDHHEYRLNYDSRLVTMVAYEDDPWCDPEVFVDKFDPQQQLVRMRYRFTGRAPSEELHSGDVPVAPRHAKTRDVSLFGKVLMRERILWVPYRPDARLRLDGRWMKVVFDEPMAAPTTKVTPHMVRRNMVMKRRTGFHPLEHVPTTRGERVYAELAKTKPARRRYQHAWVLMDRIHDAGDSGEILFRHLRANHPGINAWFVIQKDTADWDRLRKEGYADRLVAHGSRQWRLLMANCEQLLSSHADLAILRPPEIMPFVEPTWRFTFLQHGVIKDDVSRWLGHKDLDLFVTSTVPEFRSIAGEHTPYPFTTKEVVLTGLPRFDRLREIGDRYPVDRRDLVLLTPTWRHWLVQDLVEGSQERHLSSSVLGSRFVQEWIGLLGDPDLAAACRRAGVRLGFLPHPNLQRLLPHLDLPDHVLPLSYEGTDVQELFARARVLVTDYSSIAFNAAYLERPVVYFQFDAAEVLAGAHVGRPGYFEYERDGFGPVARARADTVAATIQALEHGGAPLPDYFKRIEETFPHRDGGCSERVVQAVLAASRRDAGATPVPTPPGLPGELP